MVIPSDMNILIFATPFAYWWRLLITFANSLDQDQEWQNVGPDLDPICITLSLYSQKNFLKKFILKKKSADDKIALAEYGMCWLRHFLK